MTTMATWAAVASASAQSALADFTAALVAQQQGKEQEEEVIRSVAANSPFIVSSPPPESLANTELEMLEEQSLVSIL